MHVLRRDICWGEWRCGNFHAALLRFRHGFRSADFAELLAQLQLLLAQAEEPLTECDFAKAWDAWRVVRCTLELRKSQVVFHHVKLMLQTLPFLFNGPPGIHLRRRSPYMICIPFDALLLVP